MISAEDRYDYINLAYILEVADGDEEFIEQSISTYLLSIPENITDIIAAANSRNCEKVGFLAHSLKGAFNFIGNNTLADICNALEENCHIPENHHLVPGLIAEILPLSHKAISDLQTVLSRLKA